MKMHFTHTRAPYRREGETSAGLPLGRREVARGRPPHGLRRRELRLVQRLRLSERARESAYRKDDLALLEAQQREGEGEREARGFEPFALRAPMHQAMLGVSDQEAETSTL